MNGIDVVATPEPLVMAVVVLDPPKLPVALEAGAVNSTLTPAPTRFPPMSLTVADSGSEKTVLMVALCGVPPVAVIVAGSPGIFLSE